MVNYLHLLKIEGLAFCQEHRDKKRNDKFKFKVTMSSFCEQYGYNRLNPPSRVKRIKYRQRKSNNIKHYQKYKNFNKKPTNKYYSKIIKIINQNKK